LAPDQLGVASVEADLERGRVQASFAQGLPGAFGKVLLGAFHPVQRYQNEQQEQQNEQQEQQQADQQRVAVLFAACGYGIVCLFAHATAPRCPESWVANRRLDGYRLFHNPAVA
jgi:hypothetical protein